MGFRHFAATPQMGEFSFKHPMDNMDLIVTNGIVLTMDETLKTIDNGSVGVRRGQIEFVGSSRDSSGISASRVIDARGGIIMPGLVNAYANTGFRLFRGPGNVSGGTLLDPNQVRVGADLACAEMILSGTTCFNDRSLFAGDVAAAASASGMRAVCCQVMSRDLNGSWKVASVSGDRPGCHGLDTVIPLFEAWRHDSMISISAAPDTVGDGSEQCLLECYRLCDAYGSVMGIPVTETLLEKERGPDPHDTTPVARLERLGILGPRVLVCHGLGLSEMDRCRLNHQGAALVHTPLADINQGIGIAPVTDLGSRGVVIGLGTGGGCHCPDLDLFRTMDVTAKIHKVFDKNPEVADALNLVKMATIHGAAALGLSQVTGSLCPGKRADLIVVDTSGFHMQPMYNPYSHLVYAASGHDVIVSIIDGIVVMDNRRLTVMDPEPVMDEARRFGLVTIKGNNGKDVNA